MISLKLQLPILLLSVLALSSCDKLGMGGKSGTEGENGDAKAEKESQVQVVNAMVVIDLNKVADRLGRDVALQNALKQREAQLNQELGQLRQNYQQQIQSQAESFGPEPTQGQKQQLEELRTTLNQQLVRAQQTAQQDLSQRQMNLLNEFRKEVRPFAMDVARDRGASIVLTKNQSVLFSYDSRLEITDEVIRRMSTPVVP